jgi:hypothetical protein
MKSMTNIRLVFATAFVVAVAAPETALAKKAPQISGLALQQIQSKDFEATKAVTFPAVMSVLQDSGYRIGAADRDTGLITATASTKTKMTWLPFIGFGNSKKTPVVSAYIEDRGPNMSRVRLNFVMGKVTNNSSFGGITDETPITDAIVYQDAFEKINQAVFVRLAMDAPAVPQPVAAPAVVQAAAPSALAAPTVPKK